MRLAAEFGSSRRYAAHSAIRARLVAASRTPRCEPGAMRQAALSACGSRNIRARIAEKPNWGGRCGKAGAAAVRRRAESSAKRRIAALAASLNLLTASGRLAAVLRPGSEGQNLAHERTHAGAASRARFVLCEAHCLRPGGHNLRGVFALAKVVLARHQVSVAQAAGALMQSRSVGPASRGRTICEAQLLAFS
jgi:hypothetical protein